MTNMLLNDILQIIFNKPDLWDFRRTRIVVGLWDEDGSYYAVLEDLYEPGVAIAGESSYGSDTIDEALRLLRDELEDDNVYN